VTKLANFVQFKRMLMFCLEDWRGAGPPGPPLATPLERIDQSCLAFLPDVPSHSSQCYRPLRRLNATRYLLMSDSTHAVSPIHYATSNIDRCLKPQKNT